MGKRRAAGGARPGRKERKGRGEGNEEPTGVIRGSGKVSGGFNENAKLRKYGAKDVLSPGRARQGSPEGCYLGGGLRPMDHHHKRRQKPLLVHRGRYIGTSRWGVARIVHLCPPQGRVKV